MLVLATACSPVKFVPENKYLLDNVEIQTDNKDLQTDLMVEYLRQNTNPYVFGLFRMQLGIYNLAGQDSSKWYNKMFKRVGQAPVIYDPMLSSISSNQLRLYCVNKGFVNTVVNVEEQKSDKKIKVKYKIKAGEPYTIDQYQVGITEEPLLQIAADSLRSNIQVGMNFDIDQLNSERIRITTALRDRGYYNFNKDFLEFVADSADRKVNLKLGLRSYFSTLSDSVQSGVFKPYYIKQINYNIVDAVNSLQTNTLDQDTLSLSNYNLFGPSHKFLTLSSLISSTYLQPGQIYSDRELERTYSGLNSLGPVKYVNVSFEQASKDSLNCRVDIVKNKTFSVSSQLESTYTARYWGVSGNIGTVNRNLFKGAETLSLQGRVGLEWQSNVLAQEWGVQARLSVPRMIMPLLSYNFKRNFQGSTEFKTSYDYQFRPGEFTVINVGGGLNYIWTGKSQNHRFDLVDLSYVYFPNITQAFRTAFLETGKYNSYNYENHMIMRTGYSGSHSNFNESRPLRNFRSFHYDIEAAGNTLYAVSKMFNLDKDVDGYYELFNIRYSQYLRADANYAYNLIFDKYNRIVYHAGLGLGIPYGNADAIPFERRFYSGGANSVRGWSESTLGPGVYQRITSQIRDYNQVGDIRLDLNLEYRSKLFWILEGALFVDAGNIWTVKDYSYQPGGAFAFETFYKQIALAYGAGLRFDFSFFLFRFDVGKRLYDPARLDGTNWRTNFKSSDFAYHIAIGYPF